MFLKYFPKKAEAKYEFAVLGMLAFLVGMVFSFLPMGFTMAMWWLPFATISLGLMFLGSVSILMGLMKE